MGVATIEIESDDDLMVVSGDDFGDEGVELDTSPKGMYSTAFTTRTVSGAFQIGGRAAGEEYPIRQMTLPFNLFDMGQGIEATISRFRKMWRIGQDVTFRYVSAISGERWLRVRLSKEIDFAPEKDWNIHGFARAVVSAIALQPMWESEAEHVSWSNPSAGQNVGYLPLSNPTDQDLWLEYTMDPAQWSFADFSFGQEKKWRRTVGVDADRMIVTPVLTKKLSVMADPVMDTYVAADGSNAAGLFNGIEPMYAVPAYTEELLVPVVCNGAKDATITMTSRRLWTAEAGLE